MLPAVLLHWYYAVNEAVFLPVFSLLVLFRARLLILVKRPSCAFVLCFSYRECKIHFIDLSSWNPILFFYISFLRLTYLPPQTAVLSHMSCLWWSLAGNRVSPQRLPKWEGIWMFLSRIHAPYFLLSHTVYRTFPTAADSSS